MRSERQGAIPGTDAPVLIVGGSLVGLSTAMLLGHHGVRSIVVEHHRGTAIHPRAAQVSQRTMEIFREVGLESIVRARSAEQFVQDGAIVAVESLAGRELATFIANLNEGVRDVSPAERVFISQSLLEPQLKARAEALGAELRFATEMVSFAEDDAGVRVETRHRDTGCTDTLRAAYLVACDGAHSRVRERLGIPMRGRGTFSNSATIYFRADVAPLLRGRNLSVIYVNHPELRGFFRFEKPFDRGFLAVTALGDPARPRTDVATGLTEARCVELVRLALGTDIAVTIENVMPWNAEASVADRLRQRRVFLAGDSAHVMPPNGGFGGNTGVQDAHNLAWKLALVMSGTAGPQLLATYDEERQPVGVFTTEQAYSRYVTRAAPYLGTDGIQPVAGDLDVELGYAYSSSAVCLEHDDEPRHGDPRESRGRPGTRAPHVWIERDGARVSTLDLFGRDFVLLAAPEGGVWCDAMRDVSRQRGLRVDVHRVGASGLTDRDSQVQSACGLATTGAVIVRPDGFIGWRARSAPDDRARCTQAASLALDRLLCLAPERDVASQGVDR
jgi:2-polyprenyl-6-methoxyphenol hydroxylase-like FAD-dependent oxidoreductase